MKKSISLIMPIVLLTCSSLASAEGPHDDAIKARQALMQLYSYHTSPLFDMAKGDRDYDAELASELANNLLALNSLGQSTLWPQGSDNANPENAENRALPDIWETYPEIAEKGEALHEAVVALTDEAGNGLDALKSTVGDVGSSCKGCHDDFRAEKQ